MQHGKRLSQYAVKTQVPRVGWLHYSVVDGIVTATLKRESGFVLAVLERARLVACRGTKGALIEGVEYRKKGRKHSIRDVQAWWCEAPPRTKPLLDHAARVREAERLYDEEMASWKREAA